LNIHDVRQYFEIVLFASCLIITAAEGCIILFLQDHTPLEGIILFDTSWKGKLSCRLDTPDVT
jgi:hypothetical protein